MRIMLVSTNYSMGCRIEWVGYDGIQPTSGVFLKCEPQIVIQVKLVIWQKWCNQWWNGVAQYIQWIWIFQQDLVFLFWFQPAAGWGKRTEHFRRTGLVVQDIDCCWCIAIVHTFNSIIWIHLKDCSICPVSYSSTLPNSSGFIPWLHMAGKKTGALPNNVEKRLGYNFVGGFRHGRFLGWWMGSYLPIGQKNTSQALVCFQWIMARLMMYEWREEWAY